MFHIGFEDTICSAVSCRGGVEMAATQVQVESNSRATQLYALQLHPSFIRVAPKLLSQVCLSCGPAAPKLLCSCTRVALPLLIFLALAYLVVVSAKAALQAPQNCGFGLWHPKVGAF